MLDTLRGFTAAQAVAVIVFDPLDTAGRHHVLASHGYSAAILRHATTGFGADTATYHLVSTVPHAMRWRDFRDGWHIDVTDTVTGRLLIPAGFREGASAALQVRGGRYVGSVHVSWTRADAATDRRREAIDRLLPVFAHACDLMKEPNLLARRLDPATHARVRTAAGGVALDHREPGPHLRDGAALWNLLAHVPAAGRFLWLDAERVCHRVELIPGPRGEVLVTEHRTARPHGLTIRELHTLHLVTLGDTNAGIAARLVVSPKTVATHIEHLLAKLHCGSRTELAALAVREGLQLLAPPGR
ncbi:response regulator transcription factor [Nocardia niigatensis]|uniref:helix-turn-helix transcriptional regulator n=1 Tax=Nocardia niigatensis TaxID=209249 RepID=UPI000684BB9D|nr:helix-turn-helix transcriptional regulator [Nocardia niigatensis]